MTQHKPAHDFVLYCCELLGSLGTCQPRRMFGGWGISVQGLNIAIVADLGAGEKLWLKASEASQAQWLAAGCQRFSYNATHQGETVTRSLNYYSAPESAMDSADAMQDWAHLALEAAIAAQATAKPARPRRSR